MEKESILKHCAICIQTFRGKLLFERHQLEFHTKETNIYKCNDCTSRYSKNHYLTKHKKDVHGTRAVKSKCDHCEKIFESKLKLERHIYNSHKQNRFHCDMCDESFSVQNKLKRHRGRKHLKSRDFPCKECPKKFFSVIDVRTHVVQVHSDYAPYKCNMCPAAFKRNSGWNNHLKTHLEAKDFPCPVCQKNYKCKKSLKHCLAKHENPDPEVFPCNVENCGVVLSTSNGFKGHVKTHGYRERLPCHVCSSTLSTRQDLKRHIRKVHSSEEKKFSCNIC